MTWLRIDDSFVDHPKIEQLSDVAFRLHMRAMCYCAQFSTDGQVPARKVATWAKPKVADECVAAGVWHLEGANYVVHDYLVYNPSKADLEELTRKKSEAGSKGAAIRYGRAPAVTPAIAHGRDPSPAQPIPSPAQPDPPRAPEPPPPPTANQRGYRAIENLTGNLNKPVIDAIDAFVDDHVGDAGEWLEAAAAEAALSNGRSWRYVAAILARWKLHGFKTDRRPMSPGGPLDEKAAAKLAKHDAEVARVQKLAEASR